MSQSKRWCFTLNNWTQAEYEAIVDTVCVYQIVGKEIGESGTPHLQGYIVFKNAQRLVAVRRIAARAHWETAKGSTAQNVTYCGKDGNFTTTGRVSLG